MVGRQSFLSVVYWKEILLICQKMKQQNIVKKTRYKGKLDLILPTYNMKETFFFLDVKTGLYLIKHLADNYV